MIAAHYSTHKSIILLIREAVASYLFEKNREKDIPKIAQSFLLLDDYKGDKVPLAAIIEEVNTICNILQDNYLGLKLNLLIDIERLPFYKAISECVRPFCGNNNELPLLLVSRLIHRFFFLVTQSVEVELAREKRQLRFCFTSNAPDIMSKHHIDGVMILVYRIIEDFCPGKLTKVQVAHRNSDYELEYYESVFDVPVELSDQSSLVYKLEGKDCYKNATSSLITSEGELGRRFFINPLFNMMSAQFSDISYRQRCEIVINTMIGMISPTRNHVADSMNISVSTLQRRLSEEGTSFQEVLDDTRKRLAKTYLIERKLSATDVAYLLGYKSHSQFFKAFKVWFGVTPKTYQSTLINHQQEDNDK